MEDSTYVEGVKAIGSLGEFINHYGFMVIFCALVLVLMLVFFLTYSKNMTKKSDSELHILQKEREAAINQNNQMFNLVTEVQTNQVAQLQEMTSTLRDINKSIDSTQTHIQLSELDLRKIEEDIDHMDDNYENIEKTLMEILNFAKQTDQCNKEVLNKVIFIEKSLDRLSRQRKTSKPKSTDNKSDNTSDSTD